MSDDFFRKHVLPHIAVVYVGRLRLVPIKALATWLEDNAVRRVGATRLMTTAVEVSMPNPRFPGVEPRHARDCPATGWNLDRCTCSPTYRGTAWSRKDGRLLKSPPFASATAAKNWAQDAKVDLRRGVRRAPAPMTVGQLAEAWLEQLDGGLVRTRSGRPYKPSTRIG